MVKGSRGVMAKVLKYNMKVFEFELKLFYNILYRTN